ncbi:30S ribosomal protein S8 [bacterium]|nr:30S ribosomal protein S8 [bacterium]
MASIDPISDMLTSIRNANAVGKEEVGVPASRLKVGIAKILREEGFIKHYKVVRVQKDKNKAQRRDKGAPLEGQSEIRIFLKYGPRQEKVLQGLKRISRPGLRRYIGSQEIPLIEGGLGITIVSTSSGLMTGRECRKRKTGGELVCAIW